uniref:Uncharacterized protein n=1 Tax=Physcomitrium patens TaxID=3218 RepID=A0A2K1INR5_PHYPA|nr:hypothetical protein PHYPA_027223 [Physcomitrium patens]
MRSLLAATKFEQTSFNRLCQRKREKGGSQSCQEQESVRGGDGGGGGTAKPNCGAQREQMPLLSIATMILGPLEKAVVWNQGGTKQVGNSRKQRKERSRNQYRIKNKKIKNT